MGRVGIAFGAATMLAFAMLFWLAPHQLIGLFLDHNDPAFRPVIDLAVSLLAVAAWFELFDGTQTVAMGAIRGLKDAKTTFLVGLGCYWLRLVGVGVGAGVCGNRVDPGVRMADETDAWQKPEECCNSNCHERLPVGEALVELWSDRKIEVA